MAILDTFTDNRDEFAKKKTMERNMKKDINDNEKYSTVQTWKIQLKRTQNVTISVSRLGFMRGKLISTGQKE